MSWAYFLNLISRWVLFGVAAYKTRREESGGWMLMMFAFLLAAIDPERLLLEPLGLSLVSSVSFVLDMINTAFQGVLLILAAEHLNPSTPSLRNSVLALGVGVLAYLWIVITNVSTVEVSFFLKSFGPMMVYVAGYIYMGLLLYRHVISRRWGQMLLPTGMVLLGFLNATYPVTAAWPWFIPYGFWLGTLFRIMMAIGALSFVLWPFVFPAPDDGHEVPRGAFMYPSRAAARRALGEFERIPNMILITRRDVNSLEDVLHPNAVVFWMTRVSEGELSDSPRVYAISPTKIDILTDLMAGALARGYTVVVVEAVEYLIVENGFESAFKFLLNIKDRVLLQGGTMALIVDPASLEKQQLKILEREFKME
ncbi:membrane protein, conserved [Thermococcus sp. 4557]|uniref:DUF835 domain-containing protein n=1 Tax=Thermococcus sp. (strain CGMCC 1.5172 / 4557) TaxID=1042877 RepID=UPI000219E7B9|nr:DUF835 domain-containing protein [Thermococcus sp. 4557]AEK72587.1 membrane protein, conserved [Thermococcus sp. 4557]